MAKLHQLYDFTVEAHVYGVQLPSSQGSPVLDRLLHSNLWCGQSTTSLFCQASSPYCASTQSQLVWVLAICCCRANCLELAEWWSAWSDALHWQFQMSA